MLSIPSLVHVFGAFFCISAFDAQAPKPSHDADTPSQPPTTAARATLAETSHLASDAPHDHQNDLTASNKVACRDASLVSDAPPALSTSSSSRSPRLPPELLLQIFELVIEVPFSSDVERFRAAKPRLGWPIHLTPTPYGTLANVCLASRDFCRLAQPIMYRDIVTTAQPAPHYPYAGGPHPFQTLQTRKDLASQVKRLHFVAWQGLCGCGGTHSSSPPFFPLLPNLETLVLPEWTLRLGFRHTYTRWLFRTELPSLPRPSTLVVMKEDGWFVPHTVQEDAHEMAPSLRTLVVRDPGGREQAFDLTHHQQ